MTGPSTKNPLPPPPPPPPAATTAVNAAGEEAAQQALQRALALPQIPKCYLQTFTMLQSVTDIAVVAHNFGNPVGAFTMSYAAAKSLGKTLLEATSNFERHSQQKVLDAEELMTVVQKAQARESK